MLNKKIITVAILGALMSTTSAAFDYPPAVPVADLEAFFGSTSGAISSINPGDGMYVDSPIEGSGIKDSFGFSIGDTISFDYNFMTDEVAPDYVNDYAFVAIGGQVALLDHVLGSAPFVSDAYYRETGYLSFSYSAPAAGQLEFGIGIVDVADGVVDSALLIDNIKVTRNGSVVYAEGFEIFDPMGIGDVSTGGDFYGIQPTEGGYQTLITTAPDMDPVITTAPGMAPVPLPPAAWLLFSGVVALMGFGRGKRSSS